jgi:predicted RNA-binding Zn-ribbon protein involved in translation (DUF1610 family)
MTANEEDLKRFREMFRPIAENYRRRMRNAYIIMAIALASILIDCALLLWFDSVWFVAFFVVCWITIVIAFTSGPHLRCPACGKGLDVLELGLFCPECGAQAMQKGGWVSAPLCTSCGKRLRRGRGNRMFKIRACTHCGVKLDDRGL